MPDIHDVARYAGVSKSTVSRVLTGKGAVKQDTRIAVEEAIRALNYSPSYMAQGIRTGKTRTIALLTPDFSNVFYNELFMGAEEVAIRYDYTVMITNTNMDPQREIGRAMEMVKRSIDGILYNTYERRAENIEYFAKLSKKVPVVFLDSHVSDRTDVSYVVTEGFESSARAVRYLYDRGCRRIAYASHAESIKHRCDGYRKGLQDCGLPLDPDLVYDAGYEQLREHNPDIGRDAVQKFLSLDPIPDAIMAATDYMAISIMKHLKAAGIAIPGQIKIIGFDNITLGEFVEPTLTTLGQPIRQIGRTATEILIKKINGVEGIQDRVVFTPQLLVREST